MIIWGLLCSLIFIFFLTFQWISVLFSHTLRFFDLCNDPDSYPNSDPSWLKALSAMILETIVKTMIQGLAILTFFGPKHLVIRKAGCSLILVHGYAGSWTNFAVYIRWLLRHNYSVLAMNMGSDFPNVAIQAQRLSAFINQHCRSDESIVLCGHSMGGLVCRYYAMLPGTKPHIAGILTLGSPHHGSKIWPLSFGPATADLSPHSEQINRLNERYSSEAAPPTLSIFSSFDQLIIPWTSSRLPPPAENLQFDYLGHVTLLTSPAVFKAVLQFIKRCTL